MSDEETHPDAFMAAVDGSGQSDHYQNDVEHAHSSRSARPEFAEEDEEEEDSEDDDDEDDEEEEEISHRKKKRSRKSKTDVNKFLDILADVDDDDGDEEEGDEVPDGFVTQEDVDDSDSRRRHTQLDTRRQIQDDRSAEEIAKALKGRYAGQSTVRYTGDMNEIPQRLLMPSVHDASLWQVRVKPGREREIVYSLLRKAIDLQFTNNPLHVLAAFQRDSLPGLVYIEARSSQHVSQACAGLVGVYLSRGIHLVPIDEMASLLMIKKAEQSLQIGSWVRFRRGRYAGDLAQVMDIDDTGENVGLRLVPRIDLTPKDEDANSARKRKKPMAPGTIKPPQRLFSPEDVASVYGANEVKKRGLSYIFMAETYKDGFLEKDFKVNSLITEDIQPTLDEITMFSGDDQERANVNLGAIVEAKKKAAIAVLQPGDSIEVFEGEQSGVYGIVDEINQEVVTFTASSAELEGQKIEVPAASVRKRFKPGDHVKVMHGQNTNETGLVVAVADNVVTFISDMSLQEVSVFAKDLREAAEIGSSTNTVGNYELHDLVQLDVQTVGVIFKTERDSFRVLDQNGQVRLVQPHQISMRRDSRRAIATDAENHEIRIGDLMKEIDGEGRRGHVLHVYQSLNAFLHNRDIAENSGVFVTRARSLVPVAPKGTFPKGAPGDLSKMNPAMVAPTGGMVGSGLMGRGPRDRLIGTLVVVIKGPYKSLIGTIRDMNGQTARVEIQSGNKMISIDRAKLKRKMPDGTFTPLDAPMRSNMGPPSTIRTRNNNPYTTFNNGGQTPSPGNAGGRTPAWNMGRTPNPYNEGSRTPAWSTSSKTPNPYAAERTPAWNVGSKTPNPYGGTSSWGGATPGRPAGGWGGATPGRSAGWGGSTPSGSGNGGWGGSSPGRRTDWGDSWGTEYSSAPTPASAPTPGVASAPTPGFPQTPGMHEPYVDAQTPYVVAPTPGATLGEHEDDVPPNDDYDAPKNWMFEVDEKIRTSLKVQVEHEPEDRYLDNKYNGAFGVISHAGMQQRTDPTVQVRFDRVCGHESDITDLGTSILAQYVRPVLPTEVGERVVVLSGPDKNKLCVVRDAPDPEAKTVVSTEDSSELFIVVATKALALLQSE